MQPLPFQHAQFIHVSPGKFKHVLTVRVTPLLSLEWELFIDGVSAAYLLDATANILLTADLNRALSFSNVTTVYDKLLSEVKNSLS